MGKLSIKRLEFVLTKRCNSRCANCQGAHSPESEEVIEIEDGLNYLEETTSVTELDSFMIFGGESMLYPERTITLFQRASELGIPEIELITNGLWGKDREKAKTLALRLKEAGVTDVLISVDSFHLPYIPIDSPRNAAEASLCAGISKVRWNVAVLESIDAKNEYDEQTRQIVESLQPLDLEININSIWPRGRAREDLKDFFPRQSLEGDCPDKEDTLITPDCISLDPNGWASICWNLAIGNAKEVPLSELLIDYDWKEHPVIETLVKKGPTGLLDLPQSESFDFQPKKYIDKCNLCCDLRKFVCKAYPGVYV